MSVLGLTLVLSTGCRVNYDSISTAALDSGGGGGADSNGGMGGASTSSGGVAGGGQSAGGSGGCAPTHGGVEVCDGLDNDCSGSADDGVTCPSGCRGVAFGGNGYQFCEAEIAWQSAKAACDAQGMHLVVVASAAENDFVGATAFATGIAFVWLGGDDLSVEGSWHWQDGTLFWTGTSSGSAPPGAYVNWYPGYPGSAATTDCLEMRSDLSWDDKQCSQGKRYVCELLYP